MGGWVGGWVDKMDACPGVILHIAPGGGGGGGGLRLQLLSPVGGVCSNNGIAHGVG